MKKTELKFTEDSKEVSFSKGVAIVELTTVKKFASFFMANFSRRGRFVFRGQSDAFWSVVSSFQRLAGKKKVNEHEITDHLEKFKYASRGRRGPTPKDLEDAEWWVMGQHYGLATPLVDWTTSYWVALFFAFNDRTVRMDETKFRSVYALDLDWVEETERNTKCEIKIINPILDENPRLINQAGISIQQPVQDTFEEIVKKYSSNVEQLILLKVVIPNEDVDYCIRDLNGMNINHLTLFPDLTGASGYANTVFEVGIGKKFDQSIS